MNIQKQLVVVSILLSSVGFAVAAPLGISLYQEQTALAVVTPDLDVPEYTLNDTPEVVEGHARHISVPSLGIETDVADGTYDFKTGQWSMNEGAAYHATITSLINAENGNTLIYGRNSQKIFGALSGLQPGSDIVVDTDGGYRFTYTYLANQSVTDSMKYTSKPRLTLQVCSGDHNQTHQMFYSELKNYEEITRP